MIVSMAGVETRRLLGGALLAVASLVAPGGGSWAAGAVEARYTPLDLRTCRPRDVAGEGIGAAVTCQGLDGLPVFVTEGDRRFDVDFGAADSVTDTFLPFHTLGQTVEWRLSDGAPFAAILRFAIEGNVAGTAGRRGSVLGVYRVGRDGARGCPVAYVDAAENEDANGIARQVADAFVRPFRCGVDRATYVGRTGPLSGAATATGGR